MAGQFGKTKIGVRMRTKSLVLAVVAWFLAMGCAPTSKAVPSTKEVAGRSCKEPDELLDVLTRFSTAVQAHRYHGAIALLTPEDQARMVGKDGKVPEDTKKKLDALDFKSLATDRRIDLVRGRLQGIFDCLPCLDQGPAVALEKDLQKPKLPSEPASPRGLEKARKEMAEKFYRKIQLGEWQEASGLIHPDEWAVFLDDEQNLTDLNERRMQAIEKCDLDALVLKDGLLTGLVVLLEPPVSELYLRAGIFFDFLESNQIDEAIGMLLESEKKFFLDTHGNPRPDRIAKLRALDRDQWRKLYLYHDVLLGAAEAAIGYENL